METWKGSHSEVCEQERLVTGEQVDFMGIWFGRDLTTPHSEYFPLEACQPQNSINEPNFFRLRLCLQESQVRETLRHTEGRIQSSALPSFDNYLVAVQLMKRSRVKGTTWLGSLGGPLRSTQTDPGRLEGRGSPKMRMDPLLISQGSACCCKKQTHETSLSLAKVKTVVPD